MLNRSEIIVQCITRRIAQRNRNTHTSRDGMNILTLTGEEHVEFGGLGEMSN